MFGSKARVYWIFVGALALATACVLNPQPLPPGDDRGESSSTSSSSGGASPGFDADANQSADGGDSGDAGGSGDGGDGGIRDAGDAALDAGTDGG